ncbi:MAG TPA: hypothetical protein VE178_07515, partial [Silvibacterium sp.]|nr:hypothetical protein [Silvibacterium sp.]
YMLSMADDRWIGLQGGYRIPFDPRPLLEQLEASPGAAGVWSELIEELYHQGDVGEASYAAVPQIVRICLSKEVLPWELFALVAHIELARSARNNPRLPDWLEGAYTKAIDTLALRSLQTIREAATAEQLRGALSILSLWKGFSIYASVLIGYSEEELKEILPD